MRIISASKALWHFLVAPWRVQEATPQTAMASFAIAVLLIAMTSTWCAMLENGDVSLAVESRILTQNAAVAPVKDAQLDLSSPQRQFTGALGGALMVTIVSIAALAGLFLIMTRFMTDAPVTYSMAMVSVASSALLQCADLALTTTSHLTFHTARAGLHAGIFISPLEAPVLFTWLQRISLVSVWQYIAIAIALTTWGGLHRRFGVVVGLVVWIITMLVFGALTLVNWVVSL